MHRNAEYGIAAAFRSRRGPRRPQRPRAVRGVPAPVSDEHLAWLRTVVEWQEAAVDPARFLESLRCDLAEGQVHVFADGKRLLLPANSTPVDVAYAPGPDVGDRCIAATVNGQLAFLSSPLADGDVVEIHTAPRASPRPAAPTGPVAGVADVRPHPARPAAHRTPARRGRATTRRPRRRCRSRPGSGSGRKAIRLELHRLERRSRHRRRRCWRSRPSWATRTWRRMLVAVADHDLDRRRRGRAADRPGRRRRRAGGSGRTRWRAGRSLGRMRFPAVRAGCAARVRRLLHPARCRCAAGWSGWSWPSTWSARWRWSATPRRRARPVVAAAPAARASAGRCRPACCSGASARSTVAPASWPRRPASAAPRRATPAVPNAVVHHRGCGSTWSSRPSVPASQVELIVDGAEVLEAGLAPAGQPAAADPRRPPGCSRTTASARTPTTRVRRDPGDWRPADRTSIGARARSCSRPARAAGCDRSPATCRRRCARSATWRCWTGRWPGSPRTGWPARTGSRSTPATWPTRWSAHVGDRAHVSRRAGTDPLGTGRRRWRRCATGSPAGRVLVGNADAYLARAAPARPAAAARRLGRRRPYGSSRPGRRRPAEFGDQRFAGFSLLPGRPWSRPCRPSRTTWSGRCGGRPSGPAGWRWSATTARTWTPVRPPTSWRPTCTPPAAAR